MSYVNPSKWSVCSGKKINRIQGQVAKHAISSVFRAESCSPSASYTMNVCDGRKIFSGEYKKEFSFLTFSVRKKKASWLVKIKNT